MFFYRNKKKNALNILAPVDGDLVPLDEVPAHLLNKELMGNGVAIKPCDDTIFAPCDGEVTYINDDDHTISILCENGTELLIRFGFDSGELHGEGYDLLTRVGENIYTNTPLFSFDLDYIEDNELHPYVLIVSIKHKHDKVDLEQDRGYVQANEDVIFQIYKK